MQLKEFSQNNPLRHLIHSTVKRYFWLPLVMLLLTGAGFLGFEIVPVALKRQILSSFLNTSYS